jgi:hypothetical protein
MLPCDACTTQGLVGSSLLSRWRPLWSTDAAELLACPSTHLARCRLLLEGPSALCRARLRLHAFFLKNVIYVHFVYFYGNYKWICSSLEIIYNSSEQNYKWIYSLEIKQNFIFTEQFVIPTNFSFPTIKNSEIRLRNFRDDMKGHTHVQYILR